MVAVKSQKQNNNYRSNNNPLETARDVDGSSILNSTIDVAQDIVGGFFGQKKSKENFFSKSTEKVKFVHEKTQLILYSKEQIVTQKKVNELLDALKSLSKASSSLSIETQSILVTDKIVNPGVYHVNFLEFLIKIIKDATKKINESRFWLEAVKSKKKKRSYWSMFGKHGSSFSLSGERTVSTQTN